MLSPDHLPAGLKAAALKVAAQFAEALIGKASGAGPSDRAALVLGTAEYRDGHPEQALILLSRAQDALNLNLAGTAHAYAALSEGTRRGKEATERHLRKAEENLNRILQAHETELGPHWPETALLEIALGEAKTKLAEQTTDPAAARVQVHLGKVGPTA